jgi:hypothetical protein
MSLSLIGAGFGRTGTLSIKIALERLGFGPCHHMYEIRQKPDTLCHWQEAARGGTMDWAKIFEGYVSQLDWPGSAYWRELAEVFPEARVILSVRDPEDWYASISRTILPSVQYEMARDVNDLSRAMSEMIHDTVFEGIFDGKIADRGEAIRVYEAHIETVRKTIPAERLLEFNVRDGWAPLCRFLHVDVPCESFPVANSTEEFLSRKPALAATLARRTAKA